MVLVGLLVVEALRAKALEVVLVYGVLEVHQMVLECSVRPMAMVMGLEYMVSDSGPVTV
jgi:hypothetical protein